MALAEVSAAGSKLRCDGCSESLCSASCNRLIFGILPSELGLAISKCSFGATVLVGRGQNGSTITSESSAAVAANISQTIDPTKHTCDETVCSEFRSL